jgi:hypothetical protein
VYRLVRIAALGAVTAGLLAVSAVSATAGNRHGSQPPQDIVTVGVPSGVPAGSQSALRQDG